MGTTATGLPYPEPSDPVAAGADAIKALALAIDPRLVKAIATGTGNIPITTTGTATSASVSFPGGRFSVAPLVFLTAIGNTPLSLQGPMVASVTTAGFVAWGARNSGVAGISFAWLAVQLT